jgi:deoxycytidine triphosphate deaminase
MRHITHLVASILNSSRAGMFADSDSEAGIRFERFKSLDPFPTIPPTLLNSADIMDYVAETGMIFPFYPEKPRLKPASYEANLLGKCVYWEGVDDEGRTTKKVDIIENGKTFTLKRNSIAFVTLEPMFRLPDYIAMRFNLKIKYIYAGLLLGTGPLVDPGFVGRLSIPLHNLTTNDYTFQAGEGLIWMEFTKLSPNPRWIRKGTDMSARRGTYFPFPVSKNTRSDVEDYLYAADPNRSIRSSIPIAVEHAQAAAEEAKKRVEEIAGRIRTTERRFTIGGVVVAITLLLTVVFPLLGLLYQVNSIVQDGVNYVSGVRQELSQTRSNQPTSVTNSEQQERILILESQVQDLRKQLERLTNLTSTPTTLPSSIPATPDNTTVP